MTTRTQITHETEKRREQVYLGNRDARGREIGAEIVTYESTFTEVEGADWGYGWPAGTYYTLNVHATRDGLPYGPGQPPRRFHTEQEREDARKAYLRGASKRAAAKR